MQEAPIPVDDALRLADLCALDVLDTPPERRFDRITQTAQRLFRVPIALVSLVDMNRQWFKSAAGLDATETPRNISFCGHAIHQDGLFVIPNALDDARFADNPLVTGPLQLRFYAGMPLKSSNGRALGTLCLIDRKPRQLSDDELMMLTDLGAWAERELNLREIEEASLMAERAARRLSVVLDSSSDAIIAVEDDLSVHTFNRAAEQMFGVPSRHMIGTSLRRVLPPAVIGRVDDALHRMLDEHQLNVALDGDLKLLAADGSPFDAEIRIGRTEIKRRNCFTLIIRDVTRQREADAMKSAFIATVSHELRTPITSIKGAIKLLLSRSDTPPDTQLRLLDIADKNCERLAQMVNDILDLEKMDRHELSLNTKPQPLAPSVRQVLTAMQTYADSFGVSLAFDDALADHEAVSCFDEGRITQVLANLLSNAIKFSPRGAEVQVRLERCGDEVRVSVSDRGCGIPDEFRPRIFQRFSQAAGEQVHGQAGSGLGLAICKAIVEQHGGQIGFSSEAGAGSIFHFLLPLASLEACLCTEGDPDCLPAD